MEHYRKLRNQKTKIKRESIKNYFFERCSGGPKSKDFWPTIKPFLTNKSINKGTNEIILKENDNLITDQNKVSQLLNDFYVNIAKNIGIDSGSDTNTSHPSITKIVEQNTNGESNSPFNFQHVTPDIVYKHLKNVNPKKATGIDNIPPKILKYSASTISKPLSNIVNKMIETNTFPEDLKKAQVTPLFKKDDPFTMKNYRPVSILTSTSKIFEQIINDQLSCYFDKIFHQFLSAFRPKYGCQTTLLRLVEDWKMSLDRQDYVSAILMDLSKAFDCLPHDLVVLKLGAYELSENACSLVKKYLSERKQRVKIGHACSPWLETIKGVP